MDVCGATTVVSVVVAAIRLTVSVPTGSANPKTSGSSTPNAATSVPVMDSAITASTTGLSGALLEQSFSGAGSGQQAKRPWT